MKTKEEVKEILMKEFYSVYCNNCQGNHDEEIGICECCNRKSMNWQISEHTAERLAKEITE